MELPSLMNLLSHTNKRAHTEMESSQQVPRLVLELVLSPPMSWEESTRTPLLLLKRLKGDISPSPLSRMPQQLPAVLPFLLTTLPGTSL
jgi:hypothetical protein